MKWWRFLYKIISFNFVFLVFSLFSITTYALCGFNISRARKYLIKGVAIGCSQSLRAFGVKTKLNIKGTEVDLTKSYLVVSNHLSYIDIFVISRYLPACFITSAEIKKTPYLGWICSLAGCIFVDRKNRTKISEEVSGVANALLGGLPVACFPEATSTDGSRVIDFKKALFQAAVNTNIPVLPLCINYKTVDGESISTKNRDSIFWYGDHAFFPHMVRFFSCKKIEVELSVLDSIALIPGQNDDKSILAETAHKRIQENYTPVTSPGLLPS